MKQLKVEHLQPEVDGDGWQRSASGTCVLAVGYVTSDTEQLNGDSLHVIAFENLCI